MLHIFIDADACPVKDEVYRVARRYNLRVTLVSNSPMRIPDDETISLVLVAGGLDMADDWIAERVDEGDIVITGDIPLAARCLQRGAGVIGTTGRPFTEDNVGEALATRELLAELRGAGAVTGGPPPFQKRDSSRFLQALDRLIQQTMREERRVKSEE
ncbi:MAG: YaiI/YqxD family protein [Acidobacteriota bacterium]